MKSLADRIAGLFDASYGVVIDVGGGKESPGWARVFARSDEGVFCIQAYSVTARALQVGISISGQVEFHNDLFLLFSGASAKEIENNAFNGISHHISGPLKLAMLAKAKEMEKLANELEAG